MTSPVPVNKPIKKHLSKSVIMSRNKDIVELLKMGFNVHEIAESYSLTPTTVYNVRRNYGLVNNTYVASYSEISRRLDISPEEVRKICDKFLVLAQEHFAEKEIQYSDLSLG